jgi:hypothetical protein
VILHDERSSQATGVLGQSDPIQVARNRSAASLTEPQAPGFSFGFGTSTRDEPE